MADGRSIYSQEEMDALDVGSVIHWWDRGNANIAIRRLGGWQSGYGSYLERDYSALPARVLLDAGHERMNASSEEEK
jgi:hypothetical protein